MLIVMTIVEWLDWYLGFWDPAKDTLWWSRLASAGQRPLLQPIVPSHIVFIYVFVFYWISICTCICLCMCICVQVLANYCMPLIFSTMVGMMTTLKKVWRGAVGQEAWSFSTKNRALVCPGDFCIDYFQIGAYFQSPPCLRRCFIDYRQTVFVFTDQQQQGGAFIIGGGEINIVICKLEMRGRYNQGINTALCLHSQIKLTLISGWMKQIYGTLVTPAYVLVVLLPASYFWCTAYPQWLRMLMQEMQVRNYYTFLLFQFTHWSVHI